MADELTIGNYIGTDQCDGCGKVDEVLTIGGDYNYCQPCIDKAFDAHWGVNHVNQTNT